MSYNGAPNRETWLIGLWNDESELLEEFEDQWWGAKEYTADDFAEWLESYFDEALAPQIEAIESIAVGTMLGDFLDIPLGEVDWLWIAELTLSDRD
jgi:hypothetical protein